MWYMNKGKDNDVALSSRVRLARNLTGYPFDENLNSEQSADIINKIKKVFENLDGWEFVDLLSLSEVQRAAMAESHIISRELAVKNRPSALIKNEEKSIYIMLLEEDHMRMQCILPGFNPSDAMEAVFEAEELIDSALELAYDEKLGYITHCPTNLGTGMRASVMLHLPILARSGIMKSLSAQILKLGLTVRGMNGEGSDALGSIFQISNQVTLGITEKETIDKLYGVVSQIIEKERELREKIEGEQYENLSDRVMRDIGVLMYANKITTEELIKIYSELRLGAAMRIVNIPSELLDQMLIRCMPNTICAEHDGVSAPAERDRTRSGVIRDIMSLANYKK